MFFDLAISGPRSVPAPTGRPGLQNHAFSLARAIWCLALLGCLLAPFGQALGAAQYRAATLSWDANSEPDIAGYKLSYGTASGVYDQTLDVGNVTHATVLTLAHSTDYFFVVAAYNSAGLEGPPSDEAIVLSDNANLSSLALSSGTLTPSFDTSTEAYTASVPDSTASLALTPIPADGAATVTVNGAPVPPGSQSPGIPLEVGTNTITTVVTARNGSTKSLTVTVNRTAQGPGSFTLSNQAATWDSTQPGSPAVQLTWTRSGNATSYDLYRNGSLHASNLTSTVLNDSSGLATGRTYSYYVIARNATGTRQSNTINVGPMPGPPIRIPGAFVLGNAALARTSAPAVILTWTASTAATTYDIYRNSAPYALNLGAGQLSFLNNTNLAAGQTYAYYVIARNSAGSTRSNTVSLTMPGAPKTASRVTSPEPGSTFTSPTVTFRWDAGSGVTQRTLWVGTGDGTAANARNLYSGDERGYSRTVTGLPRDGIPVYATLRSLINGAWQSNVYVYAACTGPKVVVLLHDMNTSPSVSSPNGWDPLVAALQFPDSPIIYNGKSTATASPSPQGVLCYRVMFGRKDATTSRKGLEGIAVGALSPPPTAFPGYYSGDFEQLGDLGAEVGDAISGVLSRHPSAQIVLLAHGRGGLAARAFLQSSTSNIAVRQAVVALHTVGTPHSGTPLARFYDYLMNHPRLKSDRTINAVEADNWGVVDALKANMNQGLDIRRPTTGDLIPSGSALRSLNSSLGALPMITYSSQIYTGTDLGRLVRNFGETPCDYSVFHGVVDALVPVKIMSGQAADYVLGVGKKPSDYQGDGIVPAASQALPSQGLPRGVYPGTYTYSKDVFHSEEIAQTSDIICVLKQTVTWWP